MKSYSTRQILLIKISGYRSGLEPELFRLPQARSRQSNRLSHELVVRTGNTSLLYPLTLKRNTGDVIVTDDSFNSIKYQIAGVISMCDRRSNCDTQYWVR